MSACNLVAPPHQLLLHHTHLKTEAIQRKQPMMQGKIEQHLPRWWGRRKQWNRKKYNKKCVVGFALGLTIETTPKGVLTKISLKVFHFCQHISTNMHPFMQSGKT
jgi:hypothetical protein